MLIIPNACQPTGHTVLIEKHGIDDKLQGLNGGLSSILGPNKALGKDKLIGSGWERQIPVWIGDPSREI